MANNYYFDETSKYSDTDTKDVMSARRFELVMGDIAEELAGFYSKGVNNFDEATQLATQPPFEFRIAIVLAIDILKTRSREMIEFLRQEAKSILTDKEAQIKKEGV